MPGGTTTDSTCGVVDEPLGFDPDSRSVRAGTWAATCRLGVVVSTVAGLLAATFADRVTHSTLIVAVIAGASLIGWYGTELGGSPTP